MTEQQTKWLNKKDLIGKPFELVDLETTEKVALWDDKDKKFIQEDQNITLLDGTVMEWNRYKPIPADDKKRYRRNQQYTYKIIYDGQHATVNWNKTSHDQIQKMHETLESVGETIIGKALIITKTGEGVETEYKLEIQGKDEPETKEVDLEPTEDELEMIKKVSGIIKEKKYDGKKESIKIAYINKMIEEGIKKDRVERVYKLILQVLEV